MSPRIGVDGKPLMGDRGLGDTLERLFKMIGFGKTPCKGCQKRRKKANDLVPYKRKELS